MRRRRRSPRPTAIKRALDVLKGAKRPLIILGKGAAYAQADDAIRALVEKSGMPFLPMSMAKGLLPDTHPQCAGAARSTVLKDSDVVMMIGARLNWLLSPRQGQDVGRCARRSSSRSTSSPRRWTATSRSPRPWSATSARASRPCSTAWAAAGPRRPADWMGAVTAKREENVAKMAPRLMNNNNPMDYHGALGVLRTIIKERPDAILVNEGANTLDLDARRDRHVQAAQAARRRHLGRHGHRHGPVHRRRGRDRQAGARDRGRQRVRLLRHGGRDDLPLQPAGLHRRLQQRRHLSRHRRQHRRAPIRRRPCSSRARATTR